MPKPRIGYFIQLSRPKDCRNHFSHLFSGGVLVPEYREADQFYNHLKEDLFDKSQAEIKSVSSNEDLAKKCTSLISLSFADGTNEKWIATRDSVKVMLQESAWWSLDELNLWISKRKHEALQKQAPTPKVGSSIPTLAHPGSSKIILNPPPAPGFPTTNNDSGSHSQNAPSTPETADEDIPLTTSEETVSTEPTLSFNKAIKIKMGSEGPCVIITDEAVDKWNLPADSPHRSSMEALVKTIPLLAHENLQLANQLSAAREGQRTLSSDIMDSNTKNISMTTELRNLKAKNQSLLDDLKNKTAEVDNMKKEVLEDRKETLDKIKLVHAAVDPHLLNIKTNIDRLIQIQGQPKPIHLWTGDWAKQIVAIGGPITIFATQEALDALGNSVALATDFAVLQTEGHVITQALMRGTFREFVTTIKATHTSSLPGPALFFLQYGQGCSTGDEVIDQSEVDIIKSHATRLSVLTEKDFSCPVVISLPSSSDDSAFASKVEDGLATVGGPMVTISLNKDGPKAMDSPTLCNITVGLGRAIMELLMKKGTKFPNTCSSCSAFCSGESCQATSNNTEDITEVEEITDATEAITPSSLAPSVSTAKPFKIPRKQQSTSKINEGDKATNSSNTVLCWSCGRLASTHPSGKFCNPHQMVCNLCHGRGHMNDAHYVRSPAGQEILRDRWGPGFMFLQPNQSKNNNNNKKRKHD